VFIGELSLNGRLRHTNGVLPMVGLARERGFTTIFVPDVDAGEPALVEGVEVIPVDSLRALVEHLGFNTQIDAFVPQRDIDLGEATPHEGADFREIKGQEHVKRALEVAAAGGHNVLMVGPPGSGKTLLARAMPGILPKMSANEALEVTKIYSVAAMLPNDTPLMRMRPFRAPHHTISHAGLVGGGRHPRPGEITLSHRCLPSLGRCTGLDWATGPGSPARPVALVRRSVTQLAAGHLAHYLLPPWKFGEQGAIRCNAGSKAPIYISEWVASPRPACHEDEG
jgi:magnesium chelatase family protein